MMHQYLAFLINLCFQGVNRLFVLSFENETDKTLHSGYYLPKVEIKNYNVKTDGRIFFGQQINKKLEKLLLVKAMTTHQVVY